MAALITIRVKITNPEFERPWFVSHMFDASRSTPAQQIERLNTQAARQGVNSTYELATEEQYWAYRMEIRKIIDEHHK